MWCRAGYGSALMLTSAGHEQLEQLLKQVLAMIELLHYDLVPESSSSSSSRHPISKALRKFTGRREQQRHQNQHHHDNQQPQQQHPKKEKENTQQNNGKGLHPLAYTPVSRSKSVTSP